MKQFFESDMTAMKKLSCEPNGIKYLHEFVHHPDSIHQTKKQRYYSEKPHLQKLIERFREDRSHGISSYDGLLPNPSVVY